VEPGDKNVEGGKAGNLVDLHPKSIVQHIPEHFQCEVYGCFDGHRAQPKSRVQKSSLSVLLERDGLTCDFGKPDMSWQAVNNQMLKMVKTKKDRFLDVMKIASEVYVEHVLQYAKPNWYDDCHIIDQRTSINGQDGVRFCDSLNIKTSAGHPFYESKKKHMFTESGQWDDERFVCPEIQQEIDEIWEAYTSRKMSNAVFSASLKDEARSNKKITEKNTRVFYGGPMAFIIVQRQLYLWFVKLVQDNRFIFMQAPGLDAQGPEWHELYEWLSDYSTDVIAGDFKAFDITQDAEELHIVYATMRLLAEKLGASQQHLSLMEACEKDTIFPLSIISAL
jgi:hypothetical protein